jgi:phospholipid-transporting ATPase
MADASATPAAPVAVTPSGSLRRLRNRGPKPANRTLVLGAGHPNELLRFRDNAISTGKYNLATFFPKGLYEQFRRVANLYFLSVAIISLFDTVSPIEPYTTWTPLTIVVGLSMFKEGIEDYKRHVQDRTQNLSAAERFNGTSFERCEWKDIRVGNIVRVVRDQFFPCDLIMLDSSSEENSCYVETKNLDGETNLKTKRAVDLVKDIGPLNAENMTKLSQGSSCVECEHPNNSLYTYSGNLSIGAPLFPQPKKISLNPSNMLLRGSNLRNTEWVVGIAVYTGHDTKVMMNSTDTPSKRSHVEKQMDGVVITMLLSLAILGTASAVFCSQWITSSAARHWYIDVNEQDVTFNPDNKTLVGTISFFTSYVLYGYLIPISLYVSLEFVKVFQGFVFLNKDRKMYHKDTDTPAVARTTNLNEELGMIHTVLSDKTGTLTCNSMEFFKCSIGGVSYGEGITEIERAIQARKGIKLPPVSEHEHAVESSFNFRDKRLTDGAWRDRSDKQLCRGFFRVLAVCQTVIPEGNPTPEEIVYQAESPDELAFVVAAKRFGFFFKKRTVSSIEVEEQQLDPSKPNVVVTYEILNILEFSSKRKRMSVIARSSNGKIMLFCKGADSVIYQRLTSSANGYKEATQKHMDEWAQCGLRTLCIAEREIEAQEYDSWNKKFIEASQALEQRTELLEDVAELVEKNLTLLGATAIEDKLQTGVPRTIEQLMSANIAVWVLTGDKQDTAINIGQACSLVTPNMKLRIINVEDLVKKENDGEISSAEFEELAMASVKQQLQAGLIDAEAAKLLDADIGMVIDGRSLTLALTEELSASFLALGTHCAAVICCRVSPLQKALVTTLVKNSGRITLAIGDGANDVGMIQAAHIGVGISGQEGMQAVMASDFSFAQFRYLERLILLHGRYNYKRIARMVTYFFYKNIAFGLTIFIYNMHTNASGQVVYNDWLMSSFNIFFTNFPVLALGILDQDVRPSSSLKYPALYKETQANAQFTSKRRLLWFANGIYVGVVSYMCVFYGIHGGESDTSSGRTFGLWEVGTTLYTSIVVTLNVQMALYSNFWTIYHHITIWGSIVLWFILNTVLSETDPYYSTFSYKTFVPIVSKSAKFWLGIWPVAVAGLLPYIMVITIRRNYYPTLADKVQDFDADERNKRIKSDRESITVNTDVDVTVKSPRRLGTLKGVVVESLGVEPVAAPPVPKHRRKLSFADVWGPEKQFPDIAASTSSGHVVRPPSAANSARNSLEDKNYTEVMSAIDERL